METSVIEKPAGAPQPRRVGRAPIPHEHGAWVILYAPLVITLAAFPPANLIPAVLLVIAVTGIFLGRNAIGIVIRKRQKPGTHLWLGIYLAVAAIGAIPLIAFYHYYALLRVGGLAAVLFGIHALTVIGSKRTRLDRSQWGEILSVGALTLTAPAAYTLARGGVDAIGWCLWVSCALYFSSSIFFVKMLLNAAKIKGLFTWRDRWRTGRDCVIYHVLLVFVVLAVSLIQSGLGALLSAVAYLPVLIRAFYGWSILSNKLPPLKRVGLRETFYAIWFTIFFLAALRVGQ